MNKRTMNDDLKPNYRNGWWFFFELDGQQITHHSSALSGRERVWVNDDLVVNQIGWGMFNTHKIQIADQSIELRTGFTRALDILTSRVDAELWRDGELIDRQSSQFVSNTKLLWQFAIGCGVGIAIAFSLRILMGG